VSWRVTIRPAAQTDLEEAREWYESKRPGLGDEFLLSIADALSRLEESPEQFPVYYKDFRRVLTDRFPYKVFFRIEGDAVIVFRVLHAARDHRWLLR
jgi:plasmid stabilization system protein ParE